MGMTPKLHGWLHGWKFFALCVVASVAIMAANVVIWVWLVGWAVR